MIRTKPELSDRSRIPGLNRNRPPAAYRVPFQTVVGNRFIIVASFFFFFLINASSCTFPRNNNRFVFSVQTIPEENFKPEINLKTLYIQGDVGNGISTKTIFDFFTRVGTQNRTYSNTRAIITYEYIHYS